jgi:acyl dehydratase
VPNTAFVGRAITVAEPYRVSREKVREFALAVGERDSLCHDLDAARAAGFADLVAPPTFTAVFIIPALIEFLSDPDFGWDYAHMVHGDQSFTLHQPIVAGVELSTTLHVETLVERAGSHMLTVRCEAVDTAGAPVVTTSTLFVTAAAA